MKIHVLMFWPLAFPEGLPSYTNVYTDYDAAEAVGEALIINEDNFATYHIRTHELNSYAMTYEPAK